MEYRVEKKYLVTDMELAVIARRLGAVMEQDSNQYGDCYEIRSIYFDDDKNSCMDEIETGVDLRSKYRIRTYGANASPINLEIKEKKNGYTKKRVCSISNDEYNEIIAGKMQFLYDDRKPLNQFLLKSKVSNLRPKIIITYERTAFIHTSGNVRITFDRCIRASRSINSFFDEKVEGNIPVLPSGVNILEVKYDEFLPDIIAEQLEIGKLRQTAFSKYYLGRMAVNGDFYTTV
ncbi:MAG: polyphosphate polymerase domain-containing protein [Oscillospiraceae bacterium]|nr:polyphosphate polymerase domain-containing protein [Oscillospiraceae bacterium]